MQFVVSHNATPVLFFSDNQVARKGGVFQSRVMARPLLVRGLICLLAVDGGVMADPNLRQMSEKTEVCPRCDMIFSMLETTSSGERVQHIDMVERGEGFCLVVRILPFDSFTLHSTCIRCSCTSFHGTLRRSKEIKNRKFGRFTLYKLQYTGFSCASIQNNGKRPPKIGIDGRAAICDAERSTSADA